MYQATLAYLIRDCGILEPHAEKLCTTYRHHIDTGGRLGSFAYYVAAQILKEFAETFDSHEIPEDWEGYDPDWEEPEEETADDDE